MNLFAIVSLFGGGVGSGCNGPNCGRKSFGRLSDERQWKKISQMSMDGIEKGILVRGKLLFGYGGEEHEDLWKKAGVKGYKDFYARGGIRFGVTPANTKGAEEGFVDIGKVDKEIVSNALKILERFPTLRVQFGYNKVGGKPWDPHDAFSVDGSLKEVISKVIRWQSQLAYKRVA